MRKKNYLDSIGVSFKTRYIQHKHSFKINNSSQTTLSKYVRNNGSNDIKIFWSVINKVFKIVPQNPDMCSMCNLERMAIAEANK